MRAVRVCVCYINTETGWYISTPLLDSFNISMHILRQTGLQRPDVCAVRAPRAPRDPERRSTDSVWSQPTCRHSPPHTDKPNSARGQSSSPSSNANPFLYSAFRQEYKNARSGWQPSRICTHALTEVRGVVRCHRRGDFSFCNKAAI